MKFPYKLKYRGEVKATIYRKPTGPRKAVYRLYWRVGSKRREREFSEFAVAKTEGEKLVKELRKDSDATALTTKEARAAMAAMKVLQELRIETGHKTTLDDAVREYAKAIRKLGDRSLIEAVEQFTSGTAVIQRIDVGNAAKEFLVWRKHKRVTEAKDGGRPPRSPVYEAHVATWVTEFANANPGHAVCDLRKAHVDTYFAGLRRKGKKSQSVPLSGKSKNDRRSAIRMFVEWCVKKDYLPKAHLLFDAVGFELDDHSTAKVDYYKPEELRKLLDGADDAMRPVIALRGLAGIRLDEALRLDWETVFALPGCVRLDHTITKSKEPRIVDLCPAAQAWLAPHRGNKGKVASRWPSGPNAFVRDFYNLPASLELPSRRNGLRRGFVTHHFALHQNQNLTAAQVGSESPKILSRHYKGLTTKEQGEAWFAVTPLLEQNVIQFKKTSA